MKRSWSLGLLAMLTLAASAQLAPLQQLTPAFHKAPPAHRQSLPPILSGDRLKNGFFTHAYQPVAYQMAMSTSDVIYQLPCYCWCDRALGHKSLRSCFESEHGGVCTLCMQEVAYAYQQTQLGKSPMQIRAGIDRHEYDTIDLLKLSLDQTGEHGNGSF
jgi:hypothetical protein